jgi:serine/threonine protein kinase/WD40 repeat protein
VKHGDNEPRQETHGDGDPDPLGPVLESFLTRLRRGEYPSISEFVDRYPDLAGEIRELFPALAEIERAGPPGKRAPSHANATFTENSTARGDPGDIPERLGDYRILRVLGQGGMGVVYEAVRESLRSRVALKVMHARFRAQPAYLRRFHIEARSAARLHHTNIVPVFDYGEQGGVCYYAMQYIAGHGLDVILDDVRRLRGSEPPPHATTMDHSPHQGLALSLVSGRFTRHTIADSAETETFEIPPTRTDNGADPLAGDEPARQADSLAGSSSLSDQAEGRYYREVARLGAQLADALDYAHGQGVIHRDIKPSNLLLDAQGNIWVTDFGLAKLAEGEDLSRSHDLVGTLRFMAPERFRGITDGRADIYALGATVYELLTLKPAFAEHDQVRLIDQIVHQPPVPLRLHDARIPRDLETIVLKVMAKDPRDRCEHAAELREELRRFLEGRPTRWRRVGLPEQFRRWCKRNPVVAGLNVLAVTLTIAIAVVSTVAAYHNGRLADEANRNLLQARKNLVRAHTSEAEALRQGRRVGQRFETLEAIRRAVRLGEDVGITEAERAHLRTEAIAALALPDVRVGRELDVAKARENGFAVDPAFERYAFKRDDGTVVIRRLADDAELVRFPGLPPARDHSQAGFSPDGRYLAMSSGQRDLLQVWDLRERRLVLTAPEMAWTNPNSWTFHPNGRELALNQKNRGIIVYELPSGSVLRRLPEYGDAHGCLAYSPDGSRLAIRSRAENAIHIIACNTNRRLATLRNRAPNHLAWNPRRPDILAVACEDSQIHLWNVATGRHIRVLQHQTTGGLVIAFHPNGESLASRGWNGILRLWDTRTGRQILNQSSTWGSTLAFDASGRWLALDAMPDKARLLEVADASECHALVREPFQDDARHGAVATDPTGRRFATSDWTGDVSLWDLATGATLARVPLQMDEHHVLFDPSGALLTSRIALFLWPIHERAEGAASIGPPKQLYSWETRDGFALTPDGRTLAAAMYGMGGLVLDPRDPTRLRWLRPHDDVRFIAVSPDGRWVVTGSFAGEGMKLWEAASGRLVHNFPGVPKPGKTPRSFSPDGRWLLVYDEGWVLYDTTTWKPKVRLFLGPSHDLVFAPDGRTIAYGDDRAVGWTLAELPTGRALARFRDPEQSRINRLAFTPDGTRVVASLLESPYVRVWDLPSIRRRLAELHLDWAPPTRFPAPEAPRTFPPYPEPFRVVRGKLDYWVARDNLTRAENALTAAEAELRRDPVKAERQQSVAQRCNSLAWNLLNAPPSHRNPTRALELAQRAVVLTPGDPNHLNTLTVAQYRTGLYIECIVSAERNVMIRHDGREATDLFFLAMAHARLGHLAQSRAAFDRALQSRRDHPDAAYPEAATELDMFQAEARVLLESLAPELPVNVFAPAG